MLQNFCVLCLIVIIGLSSNTRRQRFPCIWYLQQTLYSVFTTLSSNDYLYSLFLVYKEAVQLPCQCNLNSLVWYLSQSVFVLIVFVFIVFRISCLQGGNTIASPAQSLFSPPVFTTATSETIRSQCAYWQTYQKVESCTNSLFVYNIDLTTALTVICVIQCHHFHLFLFLNSADRTICGALMEQVILLQWIMLCFLTLNHFGIQYMKSSLFYPQSWKDL